MPMPRFTTSLRFSSSAARRAIHLRALIAIGASVFTGTRISPANAALYWVTKVCMWCSGLSATTTQSTSTPGIFTCRGFSEPRSARRST